MKCECSTKTAKRYRHWVTIQKPPTGTPDAYGHLDLEGGTWTTYGKIKLNFICRGGREGRVFDQIQVDASHIAETRSTVVSRAIDETMRLVFNGRNYNITLVDDVNQERQDVHLYLTEVK